MKLAELEKVVAERARVAAFPKDERPVEQVAADIIDGTVYEGDDEDVEASLSNALSMLEDCANLMEMLLVNPKKALTTRMVKDISALTGEVTAFLYEFMGDEALKNLDR